MKWTRLAAAVALLFVAGLAPVLSEDKQDKKEQPDEMEAWKKLNAPNENHKLLEKMAGNWDAEVTFVFNPEEKPEVNQMTVKREMVLGGRFLFESYELKMGRMQHEGRGYIGYDNKSKRYQMIHMESMNTRLEVTDGDWDAKTSSLAFSFGEKEMEWGGQKMKFTMRMIFTIESDNKHVFSMKTKYEGMPEEIEEIKIVYTRRK